MMWNAPSSVFGPDRDHAVVSPETLTLVERARTQHLVVRKDTDTVLAVARETDVVVRRSSEIFAPETAHVVVFRPPR